jgi:hypothetical protein
VPRSIEVSHDLFAAIWRAQLPGEKSEHEILCRLLKVPEPAKPTSLPPTENGGFADARFGFSVPAGFRVHRVYMGTRYEAYAEGNAWVRADTGQGHSSLGDLSRSIGAKTENPWFHWHFQRHDGSEGRVGELRDEKTIVRRRRGRRETMGLRD